MVDANAVFMSYRRADSADIAGRIYDRLVERFGETRVFKDVDSIQPGVAFAEYIVESIGQSAVELVIIGPSWLTVTSDGSQRRLDDSGDFVRIEIETALRQGVRIVPLLVMGASMPAIEHLPKSLTRLAELNAISVRPDPDFRHDMDRVIAAVEYWMSHPRSTPGAVAPTQPAPWIAGTQAPSVVATSYADVPRAGPPNPPTAYTPVRQPGNGSLPARRVGARPIVAIMSLALVVGVLAIALFYLPQALGTGAGLSGLPGAHRATATSAPTAPPSPTYLMAIGASSGTASYGLAVINGTQYLHSVRFAVPRGSNSPLSATFPLGQRFSHFHATIGVEDNASCFEMSGPSVCVALFELFADNVRIYSKTLAYTGASATVDLDMQALLTRKPGTLTLQVTASGGIFEGSGSWGDAIVS